MREKDANNSDFCCPSRLFSLYRLFTHASAHIRISDEVYIQMKNYTKLYYTHKILTGLKSVTFFLALSRRTDSEVS